MRDAHGDMGVDNIDMLGKGFLGMLKKYVYLLFDIPPCEGEGVGAYLSVALLVIRHL